MRRARGWRRPGRAALALAIALALIAALGSFPARGHDALAQSSAARRIPETCDDVVRATTRGAGPRTEESREDGGFGCQAAKPQRGDELLVKRVIDGDTIELATGERVRYVGIDAPETGERAEPFGKEAARLNKALVEGRYVLLLPGVQDKDRFGRLLRYVLVGGILAEAELLREGLAVAREYQPGQPYATCEAALEAEARAAGRGMWRRSP